MRGDVDDPKIYELDFFSVARVITGLSRGPGRFVHRRERDFTEEAIVVFTISDHAAPQARPLGRDFSVRRAVRRGRENRLPMTDD